MGWKKNAVGGCEEISLCVFKHSLDKCHSRDGLSTADPTFG